MCSWEGTSSSDKNRVDFNYSQLIVMSNGECEKKGEEDWMRWKKILMSKKLLARMKGNI